MSVSRSFLLETKDNEIFETINNSKNTELYQKCKKIAKEILQITNYDLITRIIDEFKFYEKIIKDKNINQHIVTIDALKRIAISMCTGTINKKQKCVV